MATSNEFWVQQRDTAMVFAVTPVRNHIDGLKKAIKAEMPDTVREAPRLTIYRHGEAEPVTTQSTPLVSNTEETPYQFELASDLNLHRENEMLREQLREVASGRLGLGDAQTARFPPMRHLMSPAPRHVAATTTTTTTAAVVVAAAAAAVAAAVVVVVAGRHERWPAGDRRREEERRRVAD